MISRRRVILDGLVLAGVGLVASGRRVFAAGSVPGELHLSCNQYVWQVFYQREQRNLGENLDGALAEMKASGLDGFEPSLGSAAEVARLVPLLEKHGLEMRSFYVNSTLHDVDSVDQSIDQILVVAGAAREVGARIVVTNPSPVRWGGGEDKDDDQLRCQAEGLNRLGRGLKALGMRLAYHNHDIELRQAAREFHHMMCGTDPEFVGLCLDAHWVYRGAGNSLVALYDIVRLYGERVCELHLRQSRNHVWTETLEAGDIDYGRVVAMLERAGVRPLLVLEQAVEGGTPHTMTALEAHRKTVAYARKVFAPFAG